MNGPVVQLDQEHLRRLATLHGVNSQGGFAVPPHDRDEPRVGPPGMTPYLGK
jgi:hypothetical protein